MAGPPHNLHGSGQPAPQSGPVSSPFWTPSLHVGAWHSPPQHTPEMQSSGKPHPSPSGHRVGQLGAPQSIAVTPSLLPPPPGAQLGRTELEQHPDLRGPAGTTPINRPDYRVYVMGHRSSQALLAS
jgi:hypothetical protein